MVLSDSFRFGSFDIYSKMLTQNENESILLAAKNHIFSKRKMLHTNYTLGVRVCVCVMPQIWNNMRTRRMMDLNNKIINIGYILNMNEVMAPVTVGKREKKERKFNKNIRQKRKDSQ